MKSEHFGGRPAYQQPLLRQQAKTIRIERRQVEVVEYGNYPAAGRRQVLQHIMRAEMG